MENEVRIQDDLYLHVNKEKLDSLVIPDDRPVAGGFAELDQNVEKLLMDKFEELASKEEHINKHMDNAIKLYKLARDVKKRDKQGIKPILKDLKQIESIKDINMLNKKLHTFLLNGYLLPFDLKVDVDMKDSNKHCLLLSGPSTILPDTTYYKDEEKAKKLLQVWESFATQVLDFTPLSDEDKKEYIKDTLAFDKEIAKIVKSSEEWSEYTKIYNPYKLSKVSRLLKPIKFKKLVSKLFEEVPEVVIVAEPRFLKEFVNLFNEETFKQYIHWSYVKRLLRGSKYLSEELRDLSGAFSRAITGVDKKVEPLKFAYQLTSNIFSEPVGLYYGETYFGKEAKKDVVEMVKEIISAYKERIKTNEILGEETKKKAILKLDTIKIKMGYPDKVEKIYDKFEITENDSLYQNVTNVEKLIIEDNLSELYKPVDKTRWAMPGHLVNACYDPSSNDITFPAAILQAPFYSINQTRSENLGGIGSVIGHEISHAFDNNGAKCDEIGNLNNWWTKDDFKRFDKKVKDMVKQYDGIELPWGKVNGKLVVSENIADNGGMAVTLHIMEKMDDANYELYFKNWAKIWCQKAKDEYREVLLNVDVHSPTCLRANITPRNFEKWYQTFDVKPTDKMYIAPNKRIIIW